MKEFITLLLILFIIAVICNLYRLNKMQNPVQKKHLTTMLFLSLAMCILQLIFLYSYGQFIGELLISLYSALVFWLIYSILLFVQNYTLIFPQNRLMKGILILYGVCDSIFLIFNSVHHAYFQVEQTFFSGMDLYSISSIHWALFLHLTICFIMGFFIIFPLGEKALVHRNAFSLRKYLVLFILVTSTLCMAFITTSIGLPVDLAVFFYVASVLSCSYLTCQVIPNLIRNQARNLIVQTADYATFFFDVKEDIIYRNEAAMALEKRYELVPLLKDQLASLISASKEELYFSELRVENNQNHSIFNITCKKIITNTEITGYYIQYFDVTKEVQRRKNTFYQITRDKLTGLYNYTYFCEKVQSFMQDHPSKSYYMIVSDIYGFKFYNSIFGHDCGNQVLLRIATLLKELSHHHSIYGRISDDEFAIFIPEENYREDTIKTCIRTIRQEFSNTRYKININAGVYQVYDFQEPVENMCDKAKLAISQIKDDYSQILSYYDGGISQSILNRQWILDEVHTALDEEQFAMYLQPQVDSRTGKWLGAEALIRWVHPRKGVISPGEFIPVLEEYAAITQVDLFIWQQAAKELARFKALGLDDLYISVNVSGHDFYHIDLYKVFTGLVDQYHISPKNLKIEITETVLAYSLEEKNKVLSKLREAGFAIAIDDFGSGFSSLNSLKDMESDIIKIDMGFLSSTGNSSRGKMIFQDVARMIHDIQMDIIVEGVETTDQLEIVNQSGCRYIQGFYYSKPLPIAEFEENLKFTKQQKKEDLF